MDKNQIDGTCYSTAASGAGWHATSAVGGHASEAAVPAEMITRDFVVDLFALADEAVPGAAPDAAEHPALARAIDAGFIPTDCLRRTKNSEVWLGVEDRPLESIERPIIVKVAARDWNQVSVKGNVPLGPESAGSTESITLGAEDARDRERRIEQIFAREAKMLSRAACQGVPKLFRFLPGGASSVLVMEFVAGKELTEAARDLNDAARLELFLRILDVVAHLHQAQIVHRDLKPEHVLVTPDGATMLVDLGLACEDETEGIGLAIAALLAGGTPRYMAPECRPESLPRQDAKLDVYSLGVMLGELFPSGSMRRLLKPVIMASQSNDSDRRLPDAMQMKLAIRSRLRVRARRRFGAMGGAGLVSAIAMSLFSVWVGQAGQADQASANPMEAPSGSSLTIADVLTPQRLGPTYRIGQECADAIAQARRDGLPVDAKDEQKFELSVVAAREAGHDWIARHLQVRAWGYGVVEDDALPGDDGLISKGQLAANGNVIWGDGQEVFWRHKGALQSQTRSWPRLRDSEPLTGRFVAMESDGRVVVATQNFEGPMLERRFSVDVQKFNLHGRFVFFKSTDNEIFRWDLDRDTIASIKTFAARVIWLSADPTRGAGLTEAMVLLGNPVDAADALSPLRYELWRIDDLEGRGEGLTKPMAQWATESEAGVNAFAVFAVDGEPQAWLGLANGELMVSSLATASSSPLPMRLVRRFPKRITRIHVVSEQNLAILDRTEPTLELVDLKTGDTLMAFQRHHLHQNIIAWDSAWDPETQTFTLLTSMGTRSWRVMPRLPWSSYWW